MLRSRPTEFISFLAAYQFSLFLSPVLGRCFGRIPTPGSFASSAFPSPPKKSSETAPKISRAPPKNQPLALGVVSTRFRAPQAKGAKKEKKKLYLNSIQIAGFVGREPEQRQVRGNGASRLTLTQRDGATERERRSNMGCKADCLVRHYARLCRFHSYLQLKLNALQTNESLHEVSQHILNH